MVAMFRSIFDTVFSPFINTPAEPLAPEPIFEMNESEYLDDFALDIFGQQGTPVYTQICMIYSLPDESPIWYSSTDIIDVLHAGLERLSASFPWVAGQVCNDYVATGNSGIYKIKYLDEVPRLTVKDLRGNSGFPTMEELRKGGYPFRLLDESVICPHNTLILPRTELLPVCLVQVTFIEGGLIFTFLGHHAVMDGIGQGVIMKLLDKACRKEQFTDDEIMIGNAPRKDIIPLLDDDVEVGPELSHQLFSSLASAPPPPPPPVAKGAKPSGPPKVFWAYFVFSGKALEELKSLASESLTGGYTSTDDCLTAFIWRSVTRARLHRLRPSDKVTLARAINVRPFLSLPLNYPGLATNMTYHNSTTEQLTGHDLGSIATNLRAEIDPKTSNLTHMTKAFATYLDRAEDKTSINLTATLDFSKDIALSSWAKLDTYDLDFGFGVGKPKAVRRPQFTPMEGLMYLMPKSSDGEIALALCLREEDMERLKSDEEFVRYGKYVV
ncbi:hypothetical protein TWF106_002568 [Orbilia oligospora]|uniref:Trichothecene 3-O-acetyltransferase-like N-terminal domain-containing protein n=1 Tax=Orbilia oligospora TaxID=2813651 RepID=A0A6G1M351_ORBOL|nr:hypothetical protein TWF788_007741 [Orbilia oligospora]KAF3199307.1 hypothetical protein TWF679_001525 [Orbilia oligospora]KAF3225430.1 hypothetical protein TWF106_002568 [Orbilia oligospora]KAF3228068.1 hypothetical protein TWF191_003006 [Orbilia oligospora]KAF3243893.1 hypothetical protein TWF192_007959 [Orbilia oligospora]